MKADIDRLMAAYGLDAIVVLGDETPNTYRDYLTQRARASGIVIKKRNEAGIFIVGGMEIDEAAKSGLIVQTLHDFDYAALYDRYGDQPEVFRRELFLNYFRKLGITGRVGFYGTADISTTLPRILALQGSTPDIEVVIGGESANLFSRAYETKDPHEIEAMREAAALTCEVVKRTWAFISGHFASREALGSPVVNADGDPLTIGAVKRFIRLQQAELGLDDPDGCIFAQGRDAGVPHSHGEDSEALQVGRSIVFDIFPRSIATGYYHDMTRTWCLGRAPEDVQAAYDQVMTIFRDAVAALKAGEPASRYQVMTLDYFEAQGHPTQRSQPGAMEGYVHSLGHGLGLNVHEAPMLSEKSRHVLAPWNVFTVEPGLYYPDRGFGVRIEDTVYFDGEGNLRTLTDFSYDLVLPLRG